MKLITNAPCSRNKCPYFTWNMRLKQCKNCEHNPNAGWKVKRKWWKNDQ